MPWIPPTRTTCTTLPITKFWREIQIATDCGRCVGKRREPLVRVAGVKDVRTDVASELVTVTFDARKTHAPNLHDIILKSGYKPAPMAD